MTDVVKVLATGTYLAPAAGFAALVFSLVFTRLVMAVAQKAGFMAQPRVDRWHSKPVALYGGVAIFAATALAGLLFVPDKPEFLGTAIGGTFIFLVGLWDDRRSLRPAHKFVAQLVAACFFVSMLYGRAATPPPFWLIPLAIVWIVGITNALNMLDNMDGLSAGVATIVAVLMAITAMRAGDIGAATAALALAGATAGFLVFNFNPARIFMGDCGSMFLGFTLACLTLKDDAALRAGNLFAALLLPTLVLATPVFDTTFVAVQRMWHARPISQGGRDHTSHRLVLLGLSERRAVCWLYGITMWFGLIALWAGAAQNWPAIFTVAALSAVGLLVFGLFLAEVQTYSAQEQARAQAARDGKTVLSRMVRHKRRYAEAILDFCLVNVCYIGAFLLRFEGALNVAHSRELTLALPFVVGAEMSAFWASGLYRGLWRYVTVSDIAAILRGVIGGALLAAVALAAGAPLVTPLATFHRSVLVIDALLLLVAVIGTRLGLKTLRYHFALRGGAGHKRVLIVGAGDAGELAVREMFNNKALQLRPVGFLDDDPSKKNASIHGVRVVGKRADLVAMIEKFNIDEVVIAMPSIGNGVVQEVIDTCDERAVAYRQVRGIIV